MTGRHVKRHVIRKRGDGWVIRLSPYDQPARAFGTLAWAKALTVADRWGDGPTGRLGPLGWRRGPDAVWRFVWRCRRCGQATARPALHHPPLCEGPVIRMPVNPHADGGTIPHIPHDGPPMVRWRLP